MALVVYEERKQIADNPEYSMWYSSKYVEGGSNIGLVNLICNGRKRIDYTKYRHGNDYSFQVTEQKQPYGIRMVKDGLWKAEVY